MRKVLHITPHLGGGVGSTVLGYCAENKTFKHEVVSFGYTPDYIIKRMELLKIPYIDHANNEQIIEKIIDCDIVLIHQWNHPLLYNFLIRNALPPCRVIMLGHNSGFYPPNIYTKKILEYPDIFVFTTPLSYDVKDVKVSLFKNNFYDIWSTDGVDRYKNIKPKKHEGFIIGYVGTVDYAKLHPDFLKMCKGIIEIIPDVKFIVVGGLKEKEIEAEADKMGIGNKFEFVGHVPESTLKEYLEIFDVFGYPLSPYHYGTCDLTLQAAMSSRIVPVVFANAMEEYMIENYKTGIIVKKEKEYVKCIRQLYKDINLRRKLGNNAREEAFKRFSLKKLNNDWENVFKKVLELPETSKKWNINKEEISYKDIFLESLGHYGKNFEARIKQLAKVPSWQTETKGSVHNYHSYFPNDSCLTKWSKLMREKKEQ